MRYQRKKITTCAAGLLIFILPAFLSCKKQNPRETEPNNTFPNANRLEPDSAVEGFLNTENDADFYIIDIQSPVILDIELSEVKGINNALKIWKGQEPAELIKTVDDARKSSPERFCNLFADAGVYYISVSHGDRDIPRSSTKDFYTLRVTSRVWENEEIEPNDDMERATPVEIGREMSGRFSPSFNRLNKNQAAQFREEDWYYFTIEEEPEEPVLIDAELSAVPGINSVLVLYNSEREELASSDLRGAGEGESVRDIGVTSAGRYYIMVCSNFESNSLLPYTLVVKTRAHDLSSEIEPNNNFKKANTIASGEVTGRIFPEGDSDFFIYNNETAREEEGPSLYRIEASSESGLDLAVNIFSAGEKKLFEADNFRGGEKEVVNLALGEEFYIQVKAKKNESSDTVYLLTVKRQPCPEGCEIEPNGTKESATRVEGGSITGYINKKKDIDYYLLSYGGSVKKNFSLHGIKDSVLKISITDPLGFIIKSETVSGNKSKKITETIDLKGYVIIEAVKENFEEPYLVEIGD